MAGGQAVPADDDSASTNPFAVSADESAEPEAIEQSLLDPSPRRIVRLDHMSARTSQHGTSP
ncbi:hypothetical protein [Streptomyces sp. NPDC002580]|uniref:hypothetical protein n=1 Tax=Streptomyces sp. NPDC002580 TaxID=3364653 RepID=UPI0036B88C9F